MTTIQNPSIAISFSLSSSSLLLLLLLLLLYIIIILILYLQKLQAAIGLDAVLNFEASTQTVLERASKQCMIHSYSYQYVYGPTYIHISV